MTKESCRLFLPQGYRMDWWGSSDSLLVNQGGRQMKTQESSPGNENGNRERDRALERTLRDALALAAIKKVADRALRQARSKAHDAGRRDLRRVAAHLAGYGTLLTYVIWHQRRTQRQSAA
jgi:hypothetical protein